MKRLITIISMVVFLIAAGSTQAVFAGNEYKDNPIDATGDWFATMGKQGLEKDQILAQRKATRTAKHAEAQAKKMGKEAEKAGGDMKKKLGF